MGKVAEEIAIGASLAEVWSVYFEPRTWQSWVDGFHAVEFSHGYPDQGGTLAWRSTPGGRGQVTETVLEHEPRRVHKISFSDPESKGELTTTFEMEGTGTKVKQELSYQLVQSSLFGGITDRFFIRSQQRSSLTRSLEHLKAEVEAAARDTAGA